MTGRRRNIWLIIDHPGQVLTALSVLKSLGDKTNVNLLVQRHEYWNKYDLKGYLDKFSRVSWFKRYDYPPPHLNIIDQILSVLLNFFGVFSLKSQLKNLPVRNNDVILGISQYQFLENLMMSIFKDNLSISLVSRSTYDHLDKKPNPSFFKYSLGSLGTRYVQKIFGMKDTVFMHRRGVKEFGDGDIFLAYKDKIKDVYDRVVVIDNIIEKTKPKAMGTDKNVFFVSYPIDFNIKSKFSRKKKSIIFIGECFLSANNLPQEIYVANINKCLDYLRHHFGSRYSLIYRPHPRETKESGLLDLEGFKVRWDKKPVEYFFLEEKNNIRSVFAICSTSSRSALNFGVDSYLFYPVFPFDKVTVRDYEELLGKFPKESFINDLSRKPRSLPAYASSSTDRLDEILKELVLNGS